MPRRERPVNSPTTSRCPPRAAAGTRSAGRTITRARPAGSSPPPGRPDPTR